MALASKEIQKKWILFLKEQKENKDFFYWNNYLKNLELKEEVGGFVVWVETEQKKSFLEKEMFLKSFVNFVGVDFLIFLKIQKKEPAKNENTSNNKEVFEIEFKNFCVGQFNQAAYEAAKQMICKKNNWKVLFLHSEPGLGKTFLLKQIKKHTSENRSFYLINGTAFGGKMFDFFHKKNKNQLLIEEWKRELEENDILMIDDIHVLAERKKTQAVLAEIVNNSLENNKSLIFTSDQPPESLVGFERRLRSRLHSGLIIKIDYPDTNTAQEIVKTQIAKTTLLKKNVTEDLVNKFAKDYKKDLRQMEGAIKQLEFNLTSQNKETFSAMELKEILRTTRKKTFVEVSVQKIKSVVARHFGVSYAALGSKSRKKEFVEARYIALFLVRDLTTKSHASIAKLFNAKNHTTVVNAVKTINKKQKESKDFQKTISLIKDLCLRSDT